jgi:hypothetical protein
MVMLICADDLIDHIICHAVEWDGGLIVFSVV